MFRKYPKNISVFAGDESTLGSTFVKRGIQQYEPSFEGISPHYIDYLKNEYEKMTEEKQEEMASLKEFYETFGEVLTNISELKEGLRDDVVLHLKGTLDEHLLEAKVGEQAKVDYEKVLLQVQVLDRKIIGLRRDLDKSEKRSLAKRKMKNKEKSRRVEEVYITKIEDRCSEYEKLKVLAAFKEQQVLDELDFQVNKCNNDYIQNLRLVLLDYQSYFKKGLEIITQAVDDLEVPLHVEEFKISERKDSTEVLRVREIFKPTIPNTVFGQEVDVVMSRLNEPGKLPRCIELMLDYLSENCDAEGIFRKVGKQEVMEYLKRHMDQGKVESLSDIKNVHTVGSTLKAYVRTLPTALCPFDDFISISDIEDEKDALSTLQRKVYLLPQGKKYLLFALLTLLIKVSDMKATNKMSLSNLALVWAMNIIRPQTSDPIALIDITPKVNSICSLLLNHFTEIFPEEPRVEYVKLAPGVPSINSDDEGADYGVDSPVGEQRQDYGKDDDPEDLDY